MNDAGPVSRYVLGQEVMVPAEYCNGCRTEVESHPGVVLRCIRSRRGYPDAEGNRGGPGPYYVVWSAHVHAERHAYVYAENEITPTGRSVRLEE